MYIKNIHGKESISKLASSIECTVGESIKGRNGYGQPAIGGNTFGIKDQLKAAGAKFDFENKVWTFESWDLLESTLVSMGAK